MLRDGQRFEKIWKERASMTGLLEKWEALTNHDVAFGPKYSRGYVWQCAALGAVAHTICLFD
jgi:hypothetical protein